MTYWNPGDDNVVELTRELVRDLFDEKNYPCPPPMPSPPWQLPKFNPKEKVVKKMKKMEGFPVRPMHDFIFVADLGMPNQSQGGVWLPDEAFKFARYKHLNERYGIVCAMGPGRMMNNRQESLCKDCTIRCSEGAIICPKLRGLQDEGLKLGSVVMFNRRFGTRLGLMFQPPEFAHPLYMRVLDPDKVLCLVENFNPWWDTERGVLHPDLLMSG